MRQSFGYSIFRVIVLLVFAFGISTPSFAKWVRYPDLQDFQDKFNDQSWPWINIDLREVNDLNAFLDFPALKKIKGLIITGMRWDAVHAKLFQKFANLRQLEDLQLEGSSFENKSAEIFFSLLPQMNLQSLSVEMGYNCSLGLNYLAAALPATQIKRLKISSDISARNAALTLLKTLPKTKITSLDFTLPYFKEEKDIELAAQYLRESDIVDLGIQGAWMSLKYWNIYFPTLSKMKLESLNLSNLGLGSQEISLLVKNLPAQLKSLNLQGNRIQLDDVEEMIHVLPKTDIKKLNLSYNGISAERSGVLSQLLNLRKIEVLNLKGNNLGSQGALELAPLILSSQGLLEIDLTENHIGVEAQDALWEVKLARKNDIRFEF